jgi:putative hydroxymethylpyrimidine transport system substrate-binding protein
MTDRISRRTAIQGLGVGALAAALAACGGKSDNSSTGSSGKGQRNVTVLLDWFPNPDHVALYVAKSKNYFSEAGLNVTLQAPSDPSDPPKLVSTGKVELGISYEPEMFLSHQAGLKVIAVGALIPTALNSVLATKKSPVKSIADLAGHTVGDAGLSSDEAFLKAIYAKYNIDGSSVKTVNLKTSLITAMISGNVDATIGGYRNIEAVQLEMMGLDPLVVPVTQAGAPDYNELVIIANPDRLTNDSSYAKLVRDFLTALQKGSQAAESSSSDAQAAMKSVAKGFDAATLAKMVDTTIPLLKGPSGFLAMDPAEWDGFGTWMVQNQLINSAISAGSVMTTKYLPRS